MTYEQTIGYLYEQLPMYSRIGPAAYKANLNNITSICEVLGNPQQRFKSIHVAGTNGKGSTCHMLAAVLQSAGYKTGLTTSPHLYDFRDRIKVNGEMIGQAFVIDFVERTKVLCAEIEPSFFELSVAMAFEYFAKQEVDIAVIETGLGGRLDSTNIISPLLSVITNIGYDHTQILGDSLEKIAEEKAGIIKKNTPIVIGEALPQTLPVFINKANDMQAEIHLAGELFMVQYIEPFGSLLLCNIKNTASGIVEKLRLDASGLYQAKNACTVLCCIEELKKLNFDIPEAAMHKGLENIKPLTGLAGRWDIVQNQPTVILDVGHNEDGIRQAIQQLQTNYSQSTFHFVLGFVNDKDISKILSLFPKDAHYYFTNAHIPRALAHEELKKMAHKSGLKGESFDNVNEAIENAKTNAGKNGVVLVCGSFFIVAEAGQKPLN